MMEGYAVSRRCNTLETAIVDLNFSVGFELYCGQRPSSSLTAECGARFGLAIPPCALELVSGPMIFICDDSIFRANVDEVNVEPIDFLDATLGTRGRRLSSVCTGCDRLTNAYD